MPVVTSHLIGTLAIIAFAATLTVYLYTVASAESVAITRSRLRMVCEYVAVRAVELISMANTSNTGRSIQTVLELPMTVSGGTYWITLVDSNGYMVGASTVLQPIVSAESMIPLNSSSVNIQIVTEELVIDGVAVKPKLYGGVEDAVVWARRIGNTIEVGLGRKL